MYKFNNDQVELPPLRLISNIMLINNIKSVGVMIFHQRILSYNALINYGRERGIDVRNGRYITARKQ